jgi:hypothetical protein
MLVGEKLPPKFSSVAIVEGGFAAPRGEAE